MTIDELRKLIKDIPDFPKPGVVFKDVTPVLADAKALHSCIEHLAAKLDGERVDVLAGIESRGFIFGAALATRMGLGFVPVRKPGKLPRAVASQSYALEYGEDTVEVHEDDIHPGMRIAVVDDLIATGGTAGAASALFAELGAEVVAALFVIELGFLGGREKLTVPVSSLIHYEE